MTIHISMRQSRIRQYSQVLPSHPSLMIPESALISLMMSSGNVSCLSSSSSALIGNRCAAYSLRLWRIMSSESLSRPAIPVHSPKSTRRRFVTLASGSVQDHVCLSHTGNGCVRRDGQCPRQSCAKRLITRSESAWQSDFNAEGDDAQR